MRQLRSEVYNYGSLTYLIQTDLAAGKGGRYTVYRIDAYGEHQCKIIGRELPLKQARKLVPVDFAKVRGYR